MKLVNGWYLPDEENFHKVINNINKNFFSCREVLTAAYKYISNFNNAIDVGTWIGDSTVLMCEKFSQVYAFEANPNLIESCNANLNSRNLKNFQLFDIALSNKKSVQKFVTAKKSTSAAWVTTIDEIDSPYIDVQTTTLDSFNFSNIDFIKIDVDGHEGFMIEGCINFLEKNNPVIAIEHKQSSAQLRQKDSPDPLKFLEDQGYSIVEQVGNFDFILKRD